MANDKELPQQNRRFHGKMRKVEKRERRKERGENEGTIFVPSSSWGLVQLGE